MADITGVVVEAVAKLISLLFKVKAARDDNKRIASEVDLFVRSLKENVARMKQMLDAIPNNGKTWTLEGLETDLRNATTYLENCLNKDFFRSMLDTRKVQLDLQSLRRSLIDAFQLKVFVTALEVAVEGDKKIENFQARILGLSAVSAATHSEATTTQIRELLAPVMMRMRRQDEKLEAFIAMFRANDDTVESSEETQKFLADVLWNLENLPRETEPVISPQPSSSDTVDGDGDVDGTRGLPQPSTTEPEDFLDPISFDVMCDPVKCSDGVTYDRWTVIDNNESSQARPLKIVCDDVNMRRRLFTELPQSHGLQEQYRSRRKAYREEALRMAKDGRHGEALKRLKNVLLWDQYDVDCRQQCQLMEVALMPSPSPTQMGGFQREMDKVNKGFQREMDKVNTSAKQDPCDVGCRICIGVLCFPCSICCITCLWPELFE